jgi:DNA-binding beta-propeller fold protein YncE
VTPNGTYAFIAGNITGDVAVVRLANNEVVGRVKTGGNPYAIAISNDGDRNDDDERVYVTQLVRRSHRSGPSGRLRRRSKQAWSAPSRWATR